VTVRAIPAYSRRFPNEVPSRVSVTLHNGQVVTSELSDYAGFHTRPPSWDDAIAKFTSLAHDRVPASRLAEVATAVYELETIPVAELATLLRATGAPATSAASVRRAV
jgi:2-methylcitrate dehydratase